MIRRITMLKGLLRYVAERETVPASLDPGIDNCSSA